MLHIVAWVEWVILGAFGYGVLVAASLPSFMNEGIAPSNISCFQQGLLPLLNISFSNLVVFILTPKWCNFPLTISRLALCHTAVFASIGYAFLGPKWSMLIHNRQIEHFFNVSEVFFGFSWTGMFIYA